MISPNAASIIVWVLWGVLLLPLSALRILQSRNTPKQRGRTWLAILYFLSVLGCFGIAVCLSVAFDDFAGAQGPVADWSSAARYYTYIGSNIHLYTSYVLQCLSLQLLTIAISRHVGHLTRPTPTAPNGSNTLPGIVVSACYWIATAITILGFIAAVCVEVFYCRGSNWRYLDRDPVKCPAWWAKLPLNTVAGVQFAAMIVLLIGGATIIFSVPRRNERKPGVAIGGTLMVIATALVAVRLALIGTKVRSPLEDGWDRIGALRLVEAIEAIAYCAAMFFTELTPMGWRRKQTGPEQVQMWATQPPPGYQQPPPGEQVPAPPYQPVYQQPYQQAPPGQTVYQMPPPPR